MNRAAIFLLLLNLVACEDAGTDDPSTRPEGATGVQVFQPPGTDFKVATRAEFTDIVVGSSITSPEPNIRRVRRGLGGNVAVGAKGRANAATTAAFGWQTDVKTLASEIQWGSGGDPSAWPAENRTSGYAWLTPEGQINGSGDQRMHEVYVAGLEPATAYHYRVGGGPEGEEVWSEVFSFTTAPNDPKAEVQLAIAGDSRGQNNDAWRLLQRRFRDRNLTAQLFSGDMINLATDQGEWEQWLDGAARDTDASLLTLASLLSLYTHGNHESHSALFYGNLVQPQDIDTFPNYGELFFSLDIGPVHIVVLDDSFIAKPDEDKAYKSAIDGWLRADLAAAVENRPNVPWIIAMHHRSCYSSAKHGNDIDVRRVRDYLVPIWDEFNVNLDIAGHDHNYERSKPLQGPPETPTIAPAAGEGTTYLVCAGAGADNYPSGESVFTAKSASYGEGGSIGVYGILTASATKLQVDAHYLYADGSDPLIESFEMSAP